MNIIWHYVRRDWRLLGFALTLAIINQTFSLLDPQILRVIFDKYVMQVSEMTLTEFVRGVGFWLLLIVGTAFVSRTAKAFQDYFVNVLTENVGARMYAESVAKVFSLPYKAFEDERSGSILLKLQKARDDSKAFIKVLIDVVFLSMVGIIFVLIYSATVHWWILGGFLLMIPVVSGIVYKLSHQIRKAQKAIVVESSDLAGSTTETLRSVGLVKALGLEKQEVGRLNMINEMVRKLEIKKVIVLRRLTFIQGTMVNAVRIFIYFILFVLFAKGKVTLGELQAFTYYTFYVFNPLYNLSDVVSRFQEAKASTGELEKILQNVPAPADAQGAVIKRVTGIEFDNVSFAHGGDEQAIDSVSLDINKGDVVGLVGPSGSGKSTLVKLLVGLYEPQKGHLKVNGMQADDFDLDSFRQRIGFVPQETDLFAGTIRDNLTFVKPEATDEECLRVLDQAAAEYILERGDETTGSGLDTIIGEAGVKLSGGERQRLAIARALLREPDLLIFDEATSALDSLTEHEIIETIKGIKEYHPDMMMIMVAHRLSTIMHADTIHVLEKGRVLERGTHAGLLKDSQLYNALWRQQSAG